jgi:hypothetical protein
MDACMHGIPLFLTGRCAMSCQGRRPGHISPTSPHTTTHIASTCIDRGLVSSSYLHHRAYMPFVTVRAAGCLGREEQKWWSIHCIKAQAGSGSSRSRRRGGGVGTQHRFEKVVYWRCALFWCRWLWGGGKRMDAGTERKGASDDILRNEAAAEGGSEELGSSAAAA